MPNSTTVATLLGVGATAAALAWWMRPDQSKPPRKYAQLLAQVRATTPSEYIEQFRKEVDAIVSAKAIQNLSHSQNPTEILPWLYLGALRDATDVERMEKLGINSILNCAPGMCWTDSQSSSLYGDAFDYAAIPADDDEGYDILGEHLDDAVEIIESARKSGKKILVHCFAGMNRSACVVVAYLMIHKRWPLLQSVQYSYDRRPMILFNTGFQTSLAELAHALGLLRDDNLMKPLSTAAAKRQGC